VVNAWRCSGVGDCVGGRLGEGAFYALCRGGGVVVGVWMTNVIVFG